ncbi:MAG: VanW family protein [Fimbriimonadaceae bacterium]|nr:VanW family protein [Fimbriimonadaceae bacterium]
MNNSKRKGSAQWIGVTCISLIALGGGGVGFAASQHIPRVEPGAKIADVDLGGLTVEEAKQKIVSYWDEASKREITLTSEGLKEQPGPMLASELGISLDLERTTRLLKTDTFWSSLSRKISNEEVKEVVIEPVFAFDESKLEVLKTFVRQNERAGEPARVFFEDGEIRRQPEVPGMKLDEANLGKAVMDAFLSGNQGTVPMIMAAKKVQDEDLEKIRTVMASSTTRFPTGNRPRSSNIALAARIINGTILLPGETFSFNGFVGRRTTARGFKTAGVFVNGRPDMDVGGGICQVSTTLYNAALKARLEVTARQPHSRPVPYVPLGQDAAVSFPQPDLRFTNNRQEPIAIMAGVSGGTITFSILGFERPEGEVKFVHSFLGSTVLPEKVIDDPSLPYGKTVVEDSDF